MKDYYKLLEVSKTATKAEIKTAYRNLAKRYHPDRNKDSKKAEAKFKDIVEAYGVLSNTFKRKAYERIQNTSAKRKSKSTGVKQTKVYDRNREEELLSRFYISMFPWAAKASIFFIIYGLLFSLDYLLPSNQSTEKIITIVEYNTNRPEGGIIPIIGAMPTSYFNNEKEKKKELLVKTEHHNFITEKDILRAAKPNIPVNLKSTIIFNSVKSITIADYNRDITIVPKLYGYPLIFPLIFILGCIVVFIGLSTKLSVEAMMFMFIVNCIVTFISFFMLFLEMHVRFYL